jgi:single-strand DNA-binding protein
MNKVIVSGYLGQDIELRFTGTGNPVANIRLATTSGWTDKVGQRQQRTEWHTIVVWGNSAKAVAAAKKSGDWLQVEGELRTRVWEDKNGTKHYTTEIYADPGGLEFGPHTNKDQRASNTQAPRQNQNSNQGGFDNPPPPDWSAAPPQDDDIPF